jgi:hypothetical protein
MGIGEVNGLFRVVDQSIRLEPDRHSSEFVTAGLPASSID